jgi:hypothetical protein
LRTKKSLRFSAFPVVLDVLRARLANSTRRKKIQTLTKEEMLEIKGGGWADVAKGSLCSAGTTLAVLLLWQARQCCRFILTGWRNWRRRILINTVDRIIRRNGKPPSEGAAQ